VAAEVGGLAAKAREATAAIGRVVGDLQREVAATAEASHDGALAVAAGLSRQSEVEASLARISEMVDHTALAAREITEATRQQRMASDQVVAAMHQVTSASSHARSATRGHATAAARLRDLAASVRSSVARFRVSATEPMNRA
jgi:methyl-accepting chemotaxis protein